MDKHGIIIKSQFPKCHTRTFIHRISCYEVLRSPMSSDSYHFSDHLDYVNEYKQGLFKLAELDCQILLTLHPSQSKIRDRLSAPEGLIDSKGCMDYADNISKRLNNRLTKEKEKGSSSE